MSDETTTLADLLSLGRSIWGHRRMDLTQIAIAAGTITGDLLRIARDQHEGVQPDPDDLRRELGNLILSTIRWASDLGYDPDQCIAAAERAQRAYLAKAELAAVREFAAKFDPRGEPPCPT